MLQGCHSPISIYMKRPGPGKAVEAARPRGFPCCSLILPTVQGGGGLSPTHAPHWHLVLPLHAHLIPPMNCPRALCPFSQGCPPHPSPGELPQCSWHQIPPPAQPPLHYRKIRLSETQANTQAKDCPTVTTYRHTLTGIPILD